MDAFEQFNNIFPDSKYRYIKPGEKTPDGSMIYPYKSMYVGPNQRVGWIISDGYCVIDCDEMDDAVRVRKYVEDSSINCCYFKTSRGMHFIFKMPSDPGYARDVVNSSHVVTTSSLVVDYRVQGAGYIVLPLHDDEREWTHLSDTIDQLPTPLYPFTSSRSTKVDIPVLKNLVEGDGRNDALFLWIKLLRAKYANPEILSEIGYMINEYVFGKPIKRNELNATVLRETNLKFAGPTNGGKRKTISEQECDVARIMLNEKQYFSDDRRLYVFNGRYYQAVRDVDIERDISTQYAPEFNSTSRIEVYKHLLTKSPYVEDQMAKSWNLISFNNFVVNIETGEQFEHSSSLFTTTHINHNYVRDAMPTQRVEDFLELCSNGDIQKRAILLEMIGDCFVKRALFQKMYIIYGEGGTGKSTLLRIITDLVGDENATYLSLQDLESTFYPWELIGKLVNVGDDIPMKRINDSSIIKKLISGERMMVQRKFGHPAAFSNHATMIFTANKLPQTIDRTTGFMRRLVLIDMNSRIQRPVSFFATQFTEADYEYLIFSSIDAIRAAIDRGELSRSFTVDNNVQAYQRMQSTLSEYIDDENLTRDNLVGRDVSSVYSEYSYYCTANGMRGIGKHNFVAEICALLFITSAKLPDDTGNNELLRFTYVDNKTN